MRGIIISLLATGAVWGSVHEEYVPCAKTYVDPEVVDLHEKKIKVHEGADTYQTSAIYSDINGLFYKDYLDRYEDAEPSPELALIEEPIVEQPTDSKLSDKQLDPLETLNPPAQTPLYTDRLITQREPTPASPAVEKPLYKKPAWPYTNKRR